MANHISIPMKKCCLFTIHSCIPEATVLSQIPTHTGAWTKTLHLPHILYSTPLYPLSSTYHLVTYPPPGTSAAGSAGSGCGWCGRSGSSSDGGRSRLHCSADSFWRSPVQKTVKETLHEPLWVAWYSRTTRVFTVSMLNLFLFFYVGQTD